MRAIGYIRLEDKKEVSLLGDRILEMGKCEEENSGIRCRCDSTPFPHWCQAQALCREGVRGAQHEARVPC